MISSGWRHGRLVAVFGVSVVVMLGGLKVRAQEAGVEASNVGTGPTLESDSQRAGYSFGQTVGRSIATRISSAPGPLDRDALLAGIADVLRGVEPRMSEAEMREAIRGLGQASRSRGEAAAEAAKREAMSRSQAARRAITEERARNAEARQRAGVGRGGNVPAEAAEVVKAVGVGDEGRRFLASNAAVEGVVVRPSGLQYQVLIEGDGARPKAGDRLTAHYIGKHIDGTVFETSLSGEREPITFTVDQVIPGWREALSLMRVGSRWELYVPTELAFGQEGRGDKVAADAVVVYEVQLMGIEPGGEEVGEEAGAAE